MAIRTRSRSDWINALFKTLPDPGARMCLRDKLSLAA